MYKEERSVFGVMVLFQLIMLILVWGPSCVNLVRLINSDFEPSYKREIVCGVGLIPVISHVVMFVDLPDTVKAETE